MVLALLLAWIYVAPPRARAFWGAPKDKTASSRRKPKKKRKAAPVDVTTLPGLSREAAPGATGQAAPAPDSAAAAPEAGQQPPAAAPAAQPETKRAAAAGKNRRRAAAKAAAPYIPYAGPRYSFQTPSGWLGPEFALSETRYLEPDGQAFISIAFIERGAPMYKEPTKFRRYMRQLGAIEDSHSLDTVRVSGRLGSRARFTTYYYPRSKLLGQALSVFRTEMIMVPDPDGLYVVRYQAAKSEYQRLRRAWLSFLSTLVLPKTSAPPEDYYVRQDHIVKELLEEKPTEDPPDLSAEKK